MSYGVLIGILRDNRLRNSQLGFSIFSRELIIKAHRSTKILFFGSFELNIYR